MGFRRSPAVSRTRFVVRLVLTAWATLSPAIAAADDAGGLCLTPLVEHEPLCNPAIAASPWAATHRASYAQASSPFAGPAPGQEISAAHLDLPNVPIALDFTGAYGDGARAIWGAPLTAEGLVVKLDEETFQVIDIYDPHQREPDAPPISLGPSGAYSSVDRDHRFIVGRERAIEVFGDAVEGDRFSSITLRRRFFLPDEFFCRDDDALIGMVLTYDGFVAFASIQGAVGVLPRQPERMNEANLRFVSLNGTDCDDATGATARLEIVSNAHSRPRRGGRSRFRPRSRRSIGRRPPGSSR